MTNLEWFRIASKKDIAEFLCHGKDCYACEAYAFCQDGCNGFLDWLEQENYNFVNTVELVRCKDCRHGHMTSDGFCKYCDRFPEFGEIYFPGHFYCADGERKKLNEN